MLGYLHSCVNSLNVKFFRHVAMNRHLKSVCFTTKISQTRNILPCFCNSGDNTAVSQLVILVIKPPFNLPNSSPVEHTAMHAYSVGYRVTIPLCTHTQLGGIYLVNIFPPSPDYFLIFLLCTWPVNLLLVSSITHMCGNFACITMT